ncbi:MAG: hypothetical protein HYR75_10470 [Gemmatimonadetes bacterium]|nr:hypothetical protein [Gemmatimonadota bacterium]MBI3567644.1 hypothetical protein [Gemmatimonadota bacterium]
MTFGSALLAALVLAGGYAALVAGHDAVAAVLLVVAYAALVPTAIMRAGRTRALVEPGRVAPVAGTTRSR